VLPYNDLDAVKKTVRKLRGKIAAVIIEPVGGNMGVVPAREKFLKGLRDVATKEKIVLIFDEVITGFRLCYGGAQNISGIIPDMTCLGKIIGGGFPVGAFGGRKEIMDCLAPVGGVYQAGTLSGNPVAMAAGVATLRILSKADYKDLGRKTKDLCKSIARAGRSAGEALAINRVGSMFTVFFTADNPYDYDSARETDTKRYARFFKALLREGIYLPPSNFETCFLSFAHRKSDIEKTKRACGKALGRL
jgi:glutamate-1-semialdehyde 2,1-aminomutase